LDWIELVGTQFYRHCMLTFIYKFIDSTSLDRPAGWAPQRCY